MNITCPYCRGTVAVKVDVQVWAEDGVIDTEITIVCDDSDCGATFAPDGLVLNDPMEKTND